MDESFIALQFKEENLVLLDQRILPTKVEYVQCATFEEV
ncbi:MAG: S-methyl-5-thioribose-1-phosphate isomerase, partial [Spirochaetia bacterium]|nr:S-methyl-5-thioribose-1-phosphate isomerase [Spirochaetia bacterium]